MKTYDFETLKLDSDRVYQAIQTELSEELIELNQSEVTTQRCELFKIPASKPGDYRVRELDFNNGLKAWCGIRHFGMNPKMPFIKILPNDNFNHPLEIKDFKQIIIKEFKVFSPKSLLITWPSQLKECHYGSLTMVKQIAPNSSKEDHLKLITPDFDHFFQWYTEQYNLFHKLQPHLKTQVPINSQEVMKHCFDQNLLKVLTDSEEQIIGAIAAEKEDFLGHPGIYFNEILVDSDFRGQGWAKKIQHQFISDLSEQDLVVWGTIDANNHPSLNTALGNGRKMVTCENFLPLP